MVGVMERFTAGAHFFIAHVEILTDLMEKVLPDLAWPSMARLTKRYMVGWNSPFLERVHPTHFSW